MKLNRFFQRKSAHMQTTGNSFGSITSSWAWFRVGIQAHGHAPVQRDRSAYGFLGVDSGCNCLSFLLNLHLVVTQFSLSDRPIDA